MQSAGIPLVPGTARALESPEQAEQLAAKVGYPVMLKAAAGGGGKGMRLVHTPRELKSDLDAARSEAERAFGDDEVYIEKAIINPRHIEIQVLADEHGNTIYLGERECSIQRRHQKVLEEAPSPIVDPEMRRKMGEVAVRVARAAGYSNAGTVEFLVDQQHNFYFLEMNTRLQVEHPVTELVTGIDLVHLQIRIAAGEKLPFVQNDIQIRGHAVECRIYAEDPENNYFPSPGAIKVLIEPSGPGIRLDSGVYQGWKVPMDYDPLLSKLIGYGSDRAQAIGRLTRTLDEYFVAGIKNNISLFRRILRDPDFRAGNVNTGFLDRMLEKQDHGPADTKLSEVAVIAAGIFVALGSTGSASDTALAASGSKSSSDKAASSWKSAGRIEALRPNIGRNS
jgi:acetyl-CoA carboxylase biotin carboxylase subunit